MLQQGDVTPLSVDAKQPETVEMPGEAFFRFPISLPVDLRPLLAGGSGHQPEVGL